MAGTAYLHAMTKLISTDPATGETVWEGQAASPVEVAAAVDAARSAFPAWARMPRDERVAAMKRYQASLKELAPAFSEIISRETGKALWETQAELAAMQGKIDISIRAQEERAGQRQVETGFGRAVLRHRPHGVAAVLGPFNFPGHLPNGHILPALLAGDTVVFKPSEEAPGTGEMIGKAMSMAGLPHGVFNIVQGGRETGAALLDQRIDALMFTGSGAAGAHFRRKFADDPHVILALELGGNNPLVAWNFGDAEAAATLVAMSGWITTGQRCSCARRLIVQDSEADALIEALAALSDRLIVDAWNADPAPFMGPLISARAAEGALAQVESLVARGARVIRPLKSERGGAFVRPALLDVTEARDLPDEEIFAPVLQLRRVSSFDQAMEAANDTKYGLSAGLLSNDGGLWDRFLDEIRAGVVNWNRPTTGAAGDMPFGGLGASGNHRPSAYYAADYCAYPVASFEADQVRSTAGEIKGLA
ncbi:succinylglutamate-semialdehyde dehydrogenase [Brevundimonas sp. 2R-24]|uniref:Succinylglutamate-semialdehyde dehydrogenase n=1 Tax=Peiella sedimenti TaxID=3061083 RepID=A0ABT8SIZ6_9CAUL|nr:succinylglutamate-semialdehyde dehydrogenase [Caulobacteraceae bacterium XZ-24]